MMLHQTDLNKVRCPWCLNDPVYMSYHDEEWGVPVTDDIKLFEYLILEGAQAGLSWITILKRREHYRKAFAGFDPKKVSRFSRDQIEKLLLNPGIIRNRLKVESSISNAKAFLKIQEEFGSFSNYQWSFVNGSPLQPRRRDLKQIPARTEISNSFSKDLKKRGFRFVGSTIIYAHMQATGMVNDHIETCFRQSEVKKIGSKSLTK